MTARPSKSYLTIAILILSGEAAFLLPFVLPRIFRPTFLDVFQMDNFQLGKCYSTYGVVAMISYLLGGPVADRFPPRKLMTIALVSTAMGGFVAATYPSHGVMQLIYGYWGFTTIFLFWAALLKATRQWGGDNRQGRAFGFLDGGRGLVSAGIGSVGVVLFSATLGGDAGENISLEQQRHAFRNVILFTSSLVGFVGLMVWFLLKTPQSQTTADDEQRKKLTIGKVLTALRMPSIWLLMLIVLCGYVGYKATDDLSLYANEVMNFNEVKSAQIGTLLLYIRPIVGVAAGFLADWTRSATWIVAGFLSMMVGAIVIASGVIGPGTLVIFYVAMFSTCIGVYAIRSLYYAAMQEGNIPLASTGTAVGLISVVGYTPDVFMGPVMGRLLDGSPGETGHQHLFWLLVGFSAAGLMAAVAFRWFFASSPAK